METTEARNVHSTLGSGIEIQLQGSGVRYGKNFLNSIRFSTCDFSIARAVRAENRGIGRDSVGVP